MYRKNMIAVIQGWMNTRKGQVLINYAYCWGAAVVILGTLFKLTHLPGADFMLFLGMGTEVTVFVISGFDHSFADVEKRGREKNHSVMVQNGNLDGPDFLSESIAAEQKKIEEMYKIYVFKMKCQLETLDMLSDKLMEQGDMQDNLNAVYRDILRVLGNKQS